MKKLIIIILLAITVASCQKSYDCTTTIVTSVSPNIQGYPQTIKSVTTVSGKKERDRLIKAATSTTTSNNGGHAITVKSSCNCK